MHFLVMTKQGSFTMLPYAESKVKLGYSPRNFGSNLGSLSQGVSVPQNAYLVLKSHSGWTDIFKVIGVRI